MNWTEAIDGTLRQWTTIRDSIGTASEVELLTEINAVCDLCETSGEEAGSGIERCQHCLFYQQQGGCRELSARMSEAVISKSWDQLRRLINETMRGMRSLELPATAKA
jgi:hypothetical protein